MSILYRVLISLFLLTSGISGGVLAYFSTSDNASSLMPDGVWEVVATPIFLPLLFVVLLLFLNNGVPTKVSQKTIDEARTAGRAATGQVTAVDTTSISVGEIPVYKVHLVVVPRDRPAYRTSLKKAITPFEVDAFKPGSLLALVRMEAEEPEVAIDTQGVVQTPPPNVIANARDWNEHRSNPFAGQRPKKKRGGRWILALIIFLAIWFVAAGIAYSVTKDLDERFRTDAVDEARVTEPVEEDSEPFYEDAARTQEAIEQVTQQYGTDVAEIHFYGHHAVLTVRAQDNPAHWDDVEVDAAAGDIANKGAATMQPEEDEYFDASLIDWTFVLPNLIDQARAALPEGRLGDISVHAYVRPIDSIGLREHWIEDFPMPDDFERYDNETFEFFNDIPKDVAAPIRDQLLADAPTTTVRVSLNHDYGSVRLVGNEWGEVYDITHD